MGQVVSSFATAVGWARRNASLTVHSKGTGTDERNGQAGGVRGWWDRGQKQKGSSLPPYHDGLKTIG